MGLTNKWQKGALICIALIASLATWHLLRYETAEPNFFPSKGVTASTASVSKSQKLVIFPKAFPDVDLRDYYTRVLGKDADQKLLFRCGAIPRNKQSENLSPAVTESEYHKFPFKIFHSNRDEFKNNEQCSSMTNNLEVEVTKTQSLDTNLEEMVYRFFGRRGAYFEDLAPLFQKKVASQMKENTLLHHWFRLAGSSVWLEQYGVHFMISRVVYSPRARRNYPVLSLSYAQLYDENWNELQNVELIVPSNNPDLDPSPGNEQIYNAIEYPSFLSTPMYHDVRKQRKKYYGPEDPRIILVQNAMGFDEPLVIFNQYHKKPLEDIEDPKDDTSLEVKFGFYRSMFMTWPWQFQRGKVAGEGLLSDKFDNQIYNRMVELRRANMPRLDKQKNWTPFISHHDRQEYHHDRYIYFVYSWSKLMVLKCDLSVTDPYISSCDIEYTMFKDHPDGGPGELRGGTQMVNINDLIDRERALVPQLDYAYKSIPTNKEIWIGFARAHLTGCGCGHFYRPNVIVLVKEDGDFKISHMSPFIDLDIHVFGFDLNDPDSYCKTSPNVLIPNGMCSWSFKGSTSLDKRKTVQDYLTLAVSVADYTVDIVHIKGLLGEILGMDNGPLHSDGDRGYNDNNVDCALASSRVFCEEYSEQHPVEKED